MGRTVHDYIAAFSTANVLAWWLNEYIDVIPQAIKVQGACRLSSDRANACVLRRILWRIAQ